MEQTNHNFSDVKVGDPKKERLTQTHELKTWSEYFDAILADKKTFEVRKNDRDFQENDILLLNRWDNVKNEYAGRQAEFTITYVLKGGQWGIEEGYCVLGLKPILRKVKKVIEEKS